MQIDFTDEEVARLSALVAAHLRKVDKAFAKFGEDFDPELGRGLLNRERVYETLKGKLLDAQENHPRSAGRDTEKLQGRDQ
jgi:hypothetical protein